MAASVCSLRVTKTFSYRGAPREFSNRYYFANNAPVTDAEWDALFDTVTGYERSIFNTNVEIIEAQGFNPPSDLPVRTKAYSLAGTLSGGVRAPGDCAAVLRQATNKRSSKNHPVYLFSYYHGACMDAAGPDTLYAAQVAAVQLLGNEWFSGLTAGSKVYVRSTPDGHLATGAHVEPWVGHRDFLN